MLEPRSRSKNNNRDETTPLLAQATGNPRLLSRTRLFLLLLAASAFWIFHNWWLKDDRRTPRVGHGLQDNGLTKDVQWDEHSLFIKGQRVFLWSGEIHPWRIPVQSQWLDILQKIKATGMNGISVYAHWGVHNPSRGTLDFDAWRDWQPFLDMAKAVGLWVVFRPGPYINAETTGGGIPGWVLSETPGDIRSNTTAYNEAWLPYITAVSKIIRRNQVTEGGPIIAVQAENEYTSRKDEGPPKKPEMMAYLRKAFIDGGVTVPQTHNDMGMWWNYVSGTGSPDLYGFDDYPVCLAQLAPMQDAYAVIQQGFDCSHPYQWHNITHSYHDYHMKAFPGSPLYIPELQAGAFDPWGPAAPTYDQCRILTDPAFQNNLYYHVFASNAKMINLYMMYGGTTWGNLPFPGVYTSYDYGSPIRESRSLSAKFEHVKLLGLFLRSVPAFYRTKVVSISSPPSINPGSLVVTHLQNPATQSGFYFIRHAHIPSSQPTDYSLRLKTVSGELQLPLFYEHFTLRNRTTDLIITDLPFGAASTLAYTSTSILFAGVMGGRDVIVLHGDMDQGYEAVIRLIGTPQRLIPHPGISTVDQQRVTGNGTLIRFLPGIKGLVKVWDSDLQLVLYCDSSTATTFHAPVLPGKLGDPFHEFWGVGTNNSVLIGGPHLVRSATFEDGTLAFQGDIQGDTMLRLVGAPLGTRRITWNDMEIETFADARSEPSITKGLIRQRAGLLDIKAPSILGPWKYQNSLPEIGDGYVDSDWIQAQNFTTNSPYKPFYGNGPVLYACDYGFCEGAVLWRGTIDSTREDIRGVRLAINGGEAFAASVWVNGHFLRTTYGNSSNNVNIVSETDERYDFPDGVLHKDKANVLLILQDNMGFDEMGSHFDANASKSPRGIRGYSLYPHGRFTSWKVQGKKGGYQGFIDRHRGIANSGGLYGERLGWHLPGFPDTEWTLRDLSQGLPSDEAGVGFFRTEFTLDISKGWDIMMSFEFEDPAGPQPYRALLFVNGWHMGKRIANLGPQYKFIVHEGILNYQGSNTVAVVLWNMEPGHEIGPRLKLVIDSKVDGGAGAHYEPGPSWEDLYGSTDDA